MLCLKIGAFIRKNIVEAMQSLTNYKFVKLFCQSYGDSSQIVLKQRILSFNMFPKSASITFISHLRMRLIPSVQTILLYSRNISGLIK